MNHSRGIEQIVRSAASRGLPAGQCGPRPLTGAVVYRSVGPQMAITPAPETAAEIAALFVPWVEQTYGAKLDYGVYSLKQVDGILDDLRKDQKFEDLQPLLFSMGCYVGEVLVRRAGGRWRSAEAVGMTAVASSPIVVAMPDGRGCNPVGKVYKRFQNGPQDSIAGFFQLMTVAPPPEKLAGEPLE